MFFSCLFLHSAAPSPNAFVMICFTAVAVFIGSWMLRALLKMIRKLVNGCLWFVLLALAALWTLQFC